MVEWAAPRDVQTLLGKRCDECTKKDIFMRKRMFPDVLDSPDADGQKPLTGKEVV